MRVRRLRGLSSRFVVGEIDVSLRAGSIPRVPRKYPYPQNFGTFGDTTPGNVSEAPFTGPFDLVMAW